ncbi:DUF6308 family protein [Arthrobacter sp. MDT3-44]
MSTAIVTQGELATQNEGKQLTLHEVLNDEARCAEHVRAYYRDNVAFGKPRTGVEFDSWVGGGDRPDVANRFTADDFVAVSLLSVNVPPAAAISLIRDEDGIVERLLRDIPVSLSITDLTTEARYREHLGPGSPADELWNLVTRKGDVRWGISQTIGSKILARKRPNLIPIVDNVIRQLIGKGRYWHDWHAAMTDDTDLPKRLESVKAASGITARGYDPGVLRLLDVILWIEGKDADRSRRDVAAAAATVLIP